MKAKHALVVKMVTLAAALALSVGCAKAIPTSLPPTQGTSSLEDCVDRLRASQEAQTPSMRLLAFRDSFVDDEALLKLYHTDRNAYMNEFRRRVKAFQSANSEITQEAIIARFPDGTVTEVLIFKNTDPKGYIAKVYVDSRGGVGTNYNQNGECR